MVTAEGWEDEGMQNYCLMAGEFQFYKMKRPSEMDTSWWSHNIRTASITSELYILKNGSDGVKSYMYFSTIEMNKIKWNHNKITNKLIYD